MNQRPSGYEPDELPTAPPRGKGLVVRVGFEPTKRNAADLQSAPFSHSGTSPLRQGELYIITGNLSINYLPSHTTYFQFDIAIYQTKKTSRFLKKSDLSVGGGARIRTADTAGMNRML